MVLLSTAELPPDLAVGPEEHEDEEANTDVLVVLDKASPDTGNPLSENESGDEELDLTNNTSKEGKQSQEDPTDVAGDDEGLLPFLSRDGRCKI